MDVQERIQKQVSGHPIVLYMKGTPMFPQCGFSGAAVSILRACGVDQFEAVNVLADQEVRQAIKDYSNWPTIPQLYIGGQFIGGSDIMRELYERGELQKLIEGAAGSK